MHKSLLYRHGFPNSRYSYLMASDRKGYNLPYRDIVKVNRTLCSLIPGTLVIQCGSRHIVTYLDVRWLSG